MCIRSRVAAEWRKAYPLSGRSDVKSDRLDTELMHHLGICFASRSFCAEMQPQSILRVLQQSEPQLSERVLSLLSHECLANFCPENAQRAWCSTKLCASLKSFRLSFPNVPPGRVVLNIFSEVATYPP